VGGRGGAWLDMWVVLSAAFSGARADVLVSLLGLLAAAGKARAAFGSSIITKS